MFLLYSVNFSVFERIIIFKERKQGKKKKERKKTRAHMSRTCAVAKSLQGGGGLCLEVGAGDQVQSLVHAKQVLSH